MLATAATRWCGEVDRVVVHSPDKDMAQLYGCPKIVGYDRRKRAFIDRDAVVRRFGVPPQSIPDYLGLVGDASDGFPGVPGWGAKSASVMLAEYRHIEGIPLETSLWKPQVRGAERLVTTLRAHMADALLFRFLAVLRRDVPLPEKGAAELAWTGVPRASFEDFCERWGFDSLAARPKLWR